MTGSAPELDDLRARVRAASLAEEAETVARLAESVDLDEPARAGIVARAAALIRQVRDAGGAGLMESFLAEYGLSSREGIALMCLAEALLRVPDPDTIDALIEDKIAPSQWGSHLGRSSSPLVNASTWALMLTGKVIAEAEDEAGLANALRGAIKRLGEPLIRIAVAQAMRELGRQFVLGRDIAEAIERAAPAQAEGYAFSYDMLGEAARTEADARHYHLAYSGAITALAETAAGDDVRANPGISVKLSALHPRFEFAQASRVMEELVGRVRALASLAKAAGMGFNIDAEEAERLDLSLDVIAASLADPALAGWDGFGVVVQAYGPRAGPLIDWLYALAQGLDRRLMVRLVKGAYWDSEIKRAQVLGLAGFPVFTRKAATDLSYLACARKLLAMADRLYPQFATHNAHSIAAILALAPDRDAFEFQRLHGMGASLHQAVKDAEGTRCRIYAPVGVHRDLLAYLVRRLLENGANSSFVNQLMDFDLAPERIAADPLAALARPEGRGPHPRIVRPDALFGPGQRNARGWDLSDPDTVAAIERARAPFAKHRWRATASGGGASAAAAAVRNPARPDDIVGDVAMAGPGELEQALTAAAEGAPAWAATAPDARAETLRRAAELYEENAGELFALLAREAGKTLADGVGEVREAVDFLRYYATEAVRLGDARPARGVIACISPWNFPLAIFTGQIAGALAAGNAVIAKPAEQTPLIAARAVELLAEAGLAPPVLQLLPGDGPDIGAGLAADPRIDGLVFTGSTATAQAINRAMAASGRPAAPLIAETGGLNAMIVDSTALPEQAVDDIIASAFQSAGQRCSALRILYVQTDIADRLLAMLFGAMDALSIGDPWALASDIGPLIDGAAAAAVTRHIAAAAADGRLLKQRTAPDSGHFVGPAAIAVDGIADLAGEVFGPVLHVARFQAETIDGVIDEINAAGYGLTFGLHSRIDSRVQQVLDRVRVGNIYVNRNQIGAVVGSQPFGGEALSGTGPKAGGPHYVARLTVGVAPRAPVPEGDPVRRDDLEAALARIATAVRAGPLETRDMPGPTGETNRLSLYPRGVVLCLGPDAAAARAQAAEALAAGNAALAAAPGLVGDTDDPALALLDGTVPAAWLSDLAGFDAVALWAEDDALRPPRRALAARDGPLIPLIVERGADIAYRLERHMCVDTTASGGNASLLAAAG